MLGKGDEDNRRQGAAPSAAGAQVLQREARAGWLLCNTSNWSAERLDQFSATPGPVVVSWGPSTISPLRVWRSSVRPTGRFDSKSMNRSLNSVFTDEGTQAQRGAATCPGSLSTHFTASS